MKTNLLEKKPSASNKTLELVPFYLNLKKILVPIDFSDASHKALKFAIPFAEQFGASITLLHIVEHYSYPKHAPFEMEHTRLLETVRERSKKKLNALYPKLVGASGIKVKTLVREGRSFEEINKLAKQMNADLIIMATHGRTGIKHVILGSTTERVVRHATCPVLTVRDGK